MTPFEIAQKYVYGEHDALTDNQEIIDMTKDIEQAIAEQLILSDVSQQRGLLKTYAELIQSSYTNHFFDDAIEESIDEFLNL